MNLTLRCYARECDGQWYAICTDLDIAADGASFKDAKASLATCIELYLEGIQETPTDEQQRLLNRKAPWHVCARMAVLSWWEGLRRHDSGFRGFVLQPPSPVPVNA
ncbi:MAG: hypothetical protein OXT64_04180 [Gammaproteobacteria bacterium]|nr:hypothetical protein [Gammaproteobacteria bacterium]